MELLNVLVIKRIPNTSLLQPFRELCMLPYERKQHDCVCGKEMLEDPAIASDGNFEQVKFCTFCENYDISNQIDLMCLGVDDTLL